MELFEVSRLAQSAHDLAADAKHDAEKASMQGTAHEQICAERYLRINDQLSDVKKAQSLAAADQKTHNTNFYDSLSVLQSKMDRAGGIDLAFRYVCLLVGLIGGMFGIYKGMHG